MERGSCVRQNLIQVVALQRKEGNENTAPNGRFFNNSNNNNNKYSFEFLTGGTKQSCKN
jgi:hypothetical protein